MIRGIYKIVYNVSATILKFCLLFSGKVYSIHPLKLDNMTDGSVVIPFL